VFLAHGEPENLDALRQRLIAAEIAPSSRLLVAELDRCYRLSPGAAEAEAPEHPRLSPSAPSRLDWHNTRAELLGLLRQRLEAAPDDAARERILADLNQRLGG